MFPPAVATRADPVARLAKGGAQSLPRHLEQPEARDLADLDSRPIHLQGIAQALLHLALVTGRGHVDEVDHDEPADIAQPQLSSHLVGSLEIRLEGGLLDIGPAGRPRGVDVDRHQRFGVVNDDRAARGEAHVVIEGTLDSALDLVPAEQRHPVLVELQPIHAARHDQAHELPGLLEHLGRVDQYLVDVLAEIVPKSADDDIAFLVDEKRRATLAPGAPNRLPHLEQVVDVGLKLLRGPSDPGGTDDEAYSVRNVESAQRFPKLRALLSLHAPGDSTRAGIVRHQDQVAPREADECGQRGALVAAFLLLDLDDYFLA